MSHWSHIVTSGNTSHTWSHLFTSGNSISYPWLNGDVNNNNNKKMKMNFQFIDLPMQVKIPCLVYLVSQVARQWKLVDTLIDWPRHMIHPRCCQSVTNRDPLASGSPMFDGLLLLLCLLDLYFAAALN